MKKLRILFVVLSMLFLAVALSGCVENKTPYTYCQEDVTNYFSCDYPECEIFAISGYEIEVLEEIEKPNDAKLKAYVFTVYYATKTSSTFCKTEYTAIIIYELNCSDRIFGKRTISENQISENQILNLNTEEIKNDKEKL